MIDIEFLLIAAPFCKDFLENVCNNVLYETGKEKLVSNLKSRKLPVNQDIERAVRNSYYMAAEQAVKYCIRAEVSKNAFEQKSLELLIDYFFSSKRNIQHANNANPLNKHFEDLDFTEVDPGELDILKSKTQVAILGELDNFLKSYKGRYLPECLKICIETGWQEQKGGKLFTFFGWIGDFFHEYVKTDERLSRFITAKWLAEIKKETRDFNKRFSDFLEKYSDEAFWLHDKVAELYTYVNPQPNLPYIFEEVKHASFDKILSFTKRYVDFVARDSELDVLASFYNGAENFSWGLLLGPGGIGKSRLALEFALSLRHRHNVNAGIITHEEFNEMKWSHWQPVCPTFIVIDDVLEISTTVIQALRHISARLGVNKYFKYPVRFLLLDRQKGEWWNEFEHECGDKIPTPAFQHMELQKLPQTGLQDIIMDCISNSDSARNVQNLDMKAVMKSLERIDNLGRPLFAIFAGIALSEGERIGKWGREDLLANYFEREHRIISKKMTQLNAESLEHYRNLAALITMSGGLLTDDIESSLDRYSYLPSSADFDKTILEYINGSDPDGKRLMPLKPDILGEYFVHAQLSPDPKRPFKDKGKRNALISEAWKLSPKSMSFFCVRFYQDLNYKTTMEALTDPANITTDDAKFYYCNYALELCAHLIKTESLKEVNMICSKLIEVCSGTSSRIVNEKKSYVLFATGILVGNLGVYPQSETEDMVEEIKLVRGDSYAWYKSESNEISPERFKLAKRIFEDAIKDDPTYANHRYGLASLLHKRSKFVTRAGAYRESEAQYNEAIRLDSKHALACQGLGNLLKDCLSHPDQAEKSFRNAIAIDARLPQAWHGLGNTLKVLEKYNESEEAYLKAIELDDDFTDPWDGMGNLLRDFLDRPEDAKNAYRRAIELNKQNAMPWNGLGNLYMDYFKDYVEAEKAYLKAVEVNPDFVFPVENLIFLYRDKTDQPEKAKELFQTHLRQLLQSGVHESVYLHMAVFSIYDKNWNAAEKYWRKIFDRMGGNISYITQFSWLRSLAMTVKLGHGNDLLELLNEDKYAVSYFTLYQSVRLLQEDLTEAVDDRQIDSEKLKRNFKYMRRFIEH
jgi:tetratricopeptide (TPR) repeat protein